MRILQTVVVDKMHISRGQILQTRVSKKIRWQSVDSVVPALKRTQRSDNTVQLVDDFVDRVSNNLLRTSVSCLVKGACGGGYRLNGQRRWRIGIRMTKLRIAFGTCGRDGSEQ